MYTIEYRAPISVGWHKLGWRFIFKTRESANAVIALRKKKYPSNTYRVVELEVQE